MWCELIQIGELHIIPIDVAKVSIGISGHWKFVTFKFVRGQWENLLFVARVVIRDAHTAGYHLVGEQTADEA